MEVCTNNENENFSMFINIFSFIFINLDTTTKSDREFYVHKIESNIDSLKVVPLNVKISNVQQNFYEPFKSREYVRIVENR